MPQSLIEAMARERIVISSDNIGSRDLINDGKNGYLFKFDEPNELAKKIKLVLEKNKNIGNEAKKTVEKFSWNLVIKDIMKVIE